MPRLPALLVLVALAAPASAAEPDKDGFVPLFNGKDLDGWVNVNGHPSTFFVKDNEIVTTGKPIAFLRTEKQYENFVLELEWMHVNKTEIANSGVFIWGDPLPAVGTPFTRGIEVQVLINYPKTDWATNHGDVFAIWGATCKPDRPHPRGAMRCLPSEERVKGAGQWNHYKVVAQDGVLKLHVNGKEVSGVSECNPRKGYLALEAEGAECHFRNIRIKEMPSTNPKPEQVAKVGEGHKSLFTGLDLDGWNTEEGAWKAVGGALKAAGTKPISTEAKYGRSELIFDWKRPAKSDGKVEVEVGGIAVAADDGGISSKWDGGPLGGSNATRTFGPEAKKAVKPGAWNRAVITLDGKAVSIAVNGKEVHRMETSFNTAGPIRFKPAEGLELMNVFVRELK